MTKLNQSEEAGDEGVDSNRKKCQMEKEFSKCWSNVARFRI